MNLFKKIKKKWMIRKANRLMQNKGVRRAKIAYWYLILSGIFAFLYLVSCIFHDYSWWYSVIPVGLFVVYLILQFIYRNFKMIRVFLTSSVRGRMLHVLNETTEWSYEHKMKVIYWIYPGSKRIRKEKAAILMNNVQQGKELSDEEKMEIKKRRVFCPQQLLDGINKAILVNALIYANTNIQPLDKEIKDILELTDQNIAKFDFKREINRCKKEAEDQEIERYKEIGRKKLKQLE